MRLQDGIEKAERVVQANHFTAEMAAGLGHQHGGIARVVDQFRRAAWHGVLAEQVLAETGEGDIQGDDLGHGGDSDARGREASYTKRT